MIALKDVTKNYSTRAGLKKVLTDVNLTIMPGEKIGILGRNGAGKSTLIRLISGAELPTSGLINRQMSVSWPMAFTGGFQGSLTGVDNIRFICRVYNANINKVICFVQEFSELGDYLYEPVKSYSSGMRARLAFALSMAIEFDCFLIDEITAVGDKRFHEKCYYELHEKRRDRAMIFVSHLPEQIAQYCDKAAVLYGGRLNHFDSVDDAYHFYHKTLSM